MQSTEVLTTAVVSSTCNATECIDPLSILETAWNQRLRNPLWGSPCPHTAIVRLLRSVVSANLW